MIEKVEEFLKKWENSEYIKGSGYYFEYKYNKDEEISFKEELDQLFEEIHFKENRFCEYSLTNIGNFDAPSCFVSYNSLSIVNDGRLYVFPIIFVNDYKGR